MSLTISGGAAIGKVLGDMILSYDQKLYREKIDELQGFYNELAAHQSKLEALRDKLQTIWNDEDAKKVKLSMDLTISNVESNMERIQHSITFYRESIETFDSSKSAVGKTLDNAIEILKNIE